MFVTVLSVPVIITNIGTVLGFGPQNSPPDILPLPQSKDRQQCSKCYHLSICRPLGSTTTSTTMHKRSVATCVILLAVLLLAELATATYRKPPFNGSIFGKRGNAAGN
jgi:hypothetical protein